MSARGAVLEILNPVLDQGRSAPLSKARLTDLQRLGLVLQAASFLALLEETGWRLPLGWRHLTVAAGGSLRVAAIEPGRSSVLPQTLLRELLLDLFGGGETISGRGKARAAARRLLATWQMDLAPTSAGQAVGQVFTEAPFLWEPPFAGIRRSLVAATKRSDGWSLWAAGGAGFFRRLCAEVKSAGNPSGDPSSIGYQEAQVRLAEEGVRELWVGAREQDSPAPSSPPTLERAQEAYDAGLFEQALVAAARFRTVDAAILRLRCQTFLGQLPVARTTVGRLERRSLDSREFLAAADPALRVLANLRDQEGQERWLDRVLEVGETSGGVAALEADILAANVAWDRRDLVSMDRHLDRSKGALDHGALAWRWYQAMGMRGIAAGDGQGVVEQLGSALRAYRRKLRRFEAAGLWNDLGYGHGLMGDWRGAERAFRHSYRLYRSCEGSKDTTLALYNLAEVRVRRGRLTGVREALEAATAMNRQGGNARAGAQDEELWARYELALGRPRAALARVLGALDRQEGVGSEWQKEELHALAARALGWMGRQDEAARQLGQATEDVLSTFEAEERPALWALAGYREKALEAAAGTPMHRLWEGLLTGRECADSQWQLLQGLEPYRAARFVYDAELIAPNLAPARWQRRAVEIFHRIGARAFAEQLEARDLGPWEALARYAEKDSTASEELKALFAEAGYGEVRLSWCPAAIGLPEHIVLHGDGGGEELAQKFESGRLVLFAESVDRPLKALFRLVARDFEPPVGRRWKTADNNGIIGESAPVVAALERVRKLATSEVPVLVHGESGTGKELFARQLHDGSPRRNGPFIPLNCAALSEQLILSDLFGHLKGAFTGADRDRAGIFETGRGGTVFLDEIGDLPLSAQGMLLRVLQEGEVRRLGESLPRRIDVRIVTATHRDLLEMVRERQFREDLFYRLKVGYLTLPPLRERGRDVILLADYFSRRTKPPVQLSKQAQARLLSHGWPGNVRELENVIQSAAALADGRRLGSDDLEFANESDSPVTDYHQSLEAFRRGLIEKTLAASKNQSDAARQLGLTRQALSYLIRQLKIT